MDQSGTELLVAFPSQIIGLFTKKIGQRPDTNKSNTFWLLSLILNVYYHPYEGTEAIYIPRVGIGNVSG